MFEWDMAVVFEHVRPSLLGLGKEGKLVVFEQWEKVGLFESGGYCKVAGTNLTVFEYVVLEHLRKGCCFNTSEKNQKVHSRVKVLIISERYGILLL